MSPADRQTRLIQELLHFEDTHERLTYVQERVRRLPPLPPEHRTEECRIQGCATRVWLAASLSQGRCEFQVDSESGLVRGLAALYAQVYSGASAKEVLAFRCTILSGAKLAARITPTRLHGLAQLENSIHAFAATCDSASQPCS